MAGFVDTDVLIVGAGPAGAASSMFLGKHGVSTFVISRTRSTATTPRAHITNQRTMEALRDAGLERDALAVATPGDLIAHHFWLRSMAGEELARTWSWGNDPRRKSDYLAASPSSLVDLPQTRMEPLLLGEAARLGAHVRFDTDLVSFEQDSDGVTAQLRDLVTGEDVRVRAKYLIGADGARSRVVKHLGIPLTGKHGLGKAYNVFVHADLSDYVSRRSGIFYLMIQPESSSWASTGNFRMVRPWDQWLVSLRGHDVADAPTPTNDEIEERLRGLIGDPDVPIKIIETSMWQINDVVADSYTLGRVFCMGDAVHRHPPANGLGSNTSIQDAFNLAWKLALVLQGKASPTLLDSYNDERQPVGQQIVARANRSMIPNFNVWDMLGAGLRAKLTADEHAAVFDTPEGRAELQRELDGLQYEQHAHGVEMNRRYVSGAVVPDGTPDPGYQRDPELYYQPSTRPGSPLPHAWLGTRHPGPEHSTLDLAGKRRFTLLTGHGGEPWREAAHKVSEQTGVEITVAAIGPGLDYEDLYRTWRTLSEIEENGALLVRPDLHIAWRSHTLPADPFTALDTAMRFILGR
jgi:2,4-dichlorophenol 6-monooxygenase